MDILLEKTDPEENCFRFYRIELTPDLFADCALQVHWGRQGSKGRVQIRGSGSVSECQVMAERILKLRLRRGYREIRGA